MPDLTPVLRAALLRTLAGLDQDAAKLVRTRLLAEPAPAIDHDSPDPEADEAMACWLAPVLHALNR